MVAKIISALVHDPLFVEAIQQKIGSAVDTAAMEQELEALRGQLRQALGTKARLERQMDSLDIDEPYYDRKVLDLQRRYDEQYAKAAELEAGIEDKQEQIHMLQQDKLSKDNVYQLLLGFDQVYAAASEVERKDLMRAFIDRIELFPEKRQDGCWIKNIVFNFPIPVNGQDVVDLSSLESGGIVETVVQLVRKIRI